jgi:hypothetical protein
MCGSTSFGRFLAHHQELYNSISSLWFYRWSVAVAIKMSINSHYIYVFIRLLINFIHAKFIQI